MLLRLRTSESGGREKTIPAGIGTLTLCLLCAASTPISAATPAQVVPQAAKQAPLSQPTVPLGLVSSVAPTHQPEPAPDPDRLDSLFRLAVRRFWSVEPKPDLYQNQFDSLHELSATDPKRPGYRLAADTAEAFLRAQAKTGKTDWRTPAALYLDVMSLASLGKHAKVVASADRLLHDFPDYRRYRTDLSTTYSHLVRGPVIQLRLYALRCLLEPVPQDAAQPASGPMPIAMASSKPGPVSTAKPSTAATKSPVQPTPSTRDADIAAVLDKRPILAFLADLTAQAEVAMTEERAAQSRSGMDAFMADGTLEPDELRANALPETLLTVIAIHERLLPLALKAGNPKALRDYLRTIAAEQVSYEGETQHPFFGYANRKLQSIDKEILDFYCASVEASLKAKQWEAARSGYFAILADYPGAGPGKDATARLLKLITASYSTESDADVTTAKYDDAKSLLLQLIKFYAGTEAEDEGHRKLDELSLLLIGIYNKQGDALMKPPGQRYAEAKVLYEKALAENPDGPGAEHALLKLGAVYKGLKQSAKALEVLAKFEAKFPHSEGLAEARQDKALALLWTHADPKATMAAFQDVVTKNPESAQASEAEYFTGYLLWQSGRKAEAKAAMTAVIDKYPDSPYVRAAQKDLEILK